MYIYLEEAQISKKDAKTVMEWRNNPTTLKMFYNQLPKKWPAFWTEYKDTYFKYKKLPPHFAKHNGQQIAFLRSSPYKDPKLKGIVFDIDINLCKSFRKKGLSSKILHLYATHLFNQGANLIVAEVKKINKASIRSFEKAGFSLHDEKTKTVYGKPVEIYRLTKKNQKLFKKVKRKPTFIIAEAGSNWRMGTPDRDMAMAKTLIEVAADAGADAVKFQTYRSKTVYVPNAGQADYLSNSGEKRQINEIFDDLSMPYAMIPKLAQYAKKCGIEFMSTPFSVDDLKALNPHVHKHKLASYEITHMRLLDALVKTGKPLIISTGGSNLEEITYSVNRFYDQGGKDLTIMQCTAKYPAPLSSLNLLVIQTLANTFNCAVGLSDHSQDPIIGPCAAVSLGATVIEKHYTIDNKLPGPDHTFAINPKQLKQMVQAIRKTEKSLGSPFKVPSKEEEELRSFAIRSIQATKNIKKGELLKEGKNFDTLRSGKQKQGIHPKYLDQVHGKRAQRNIPIGDGIKLGDIEK